jgi:hypothetical protein
VTSVRKEITVETSQARAFRAFTEEHGAWWPLATHHIGEKDAETAIIEPRAGGRWFERAADGTECQWGKVLGPNWKHDPDFSTEVEVRFVVLGPALTRIELEHRQIERFGEAAETMRGAFESEGGWLGIMQRFAAHAAK